MGKKIFTSESVTSGHPDKIADQLSDTILDAVLEQDPTSRVACECLVTTGLVVVAGEMRTSAYVDIQKLVRDKINEIGYNRAKYGFDGNTCGVIVSLDEQSSDIAMGVDESFETKRGDSAQLGAGDQGLMFGFACNETATYMPLPIYLSHKLSRRLMDVREQNIVPHLRPDGKTQVSVEYDDNGSVKRIDAVVVSTQHSEDISLDELRDLIKKEVIDFTLDENLVDENTLYYINPTGNFVIGGPNGDCGLTGRKIIVDTYGGYSRHGGGAFSGKDATKVDRSASYMARYIAKNLVAAGVASKLEVQLSYAIGVANPTSVLVETFGTSEYKSEEIIKCIRTVFGLTPSEIIKQLDLTKPIFSKTAAYGHFGREDIEFNWEKLDKVEEIKKIFNIK